MSARTIVLMLAMIPAAASLAEVITFDDVLPWQVVPNNTGSYTTKGYAFTPVAGNANGYLVAGSFQPDGNSQGNQTLANNGTPNLMCGNWVNLTLAPIDPQQFDLSSFQLGGTFDQEQVHRWAWASFVNIIGHREGQSNLTARIEMESDFELRTITLNWTGLTSLEFIPERSLIGMGTNDYEFTIDSLVVTTLPIAPTCPQCAADFDGNGGVDGGDLAAFFAEYEAGGDCADVDQNGGVDGGDLAAFFAAFESGGC